ncbi:hypothetical protein PISL3812_07653 [Talaromyces islandicus]|uniref:Uncharacterized protein n=1 Tax=Talaromyces islandicus TaxID=28573 RepID=A0A0U1M4U0_TALIS|nr:hypothetical protein PISL3812_07653 [Talaromyces islandicus]
MTATFGTNDVMTSGTQRRSKLSNVVKVSPSVEIALVREYPPLPFVSIKHLFDTVAERRNLLEENPDKLQYISFSNVTVSTVVAVEKCREQRRLHFRQTYFPDIQTLIIKVPSCIHERAHTNLGFELVRRYHDMGMKRAEFYGWGATTTKSRNQSPGQTHSSKEGDSSFKNKLLRPGNDFPSLMIEVGNLESISHLRMAAHWWIEHSDGRVNIVILVKIEKAKKRVTFYKYVPRPPSTQFPGLRSIPSVKATQVAEIVIDQSTSPSPISGAPLILEFTAVFDRQPNPPREKDLVLSGQDLDGLISEMW